MNKTSISAKNKTLYEAMKKGDNKTMKKLLYKDLLPKILAFTNVQGNKDDAFDIFQDVVIMMVKKIRFGSFAETDDIMGYMFMAVKNRWINKIKKDSREAELENSDIVEDSQELKDEADLKRREKDIIEMFKMLGDKCAKLLQLLVYSEISTEDVAYELNMSGPKVVKTSKNRCKNRLIQLLEERPDIKQMLLKNDWRFSKYI